MSELIERVVWPIACELMELTADQRRAYTPDDVNGDTWDRALSAARAAIRAMREPTEAMKKEAGYNAAMSHTEVSGATAGWLYTTMIDAALAEP